jgi:hypothetical protein
MLGLAKRLRVPILQASTSEVYGDPLVHPHDRLVRRHGLTGVEQRTKPSRLLGNTDPLRAMN